MRRFLAIGISSVLLAACGGHGPTAPDSLAAGGAPPTSATGYSGTNRSLGTFELTFTADPACEDLPIEARTRTYVAPLRSGSTLTTLGGASFVPAASPYAAWNVLYTTVSSDSAELWFQDPPIWEALANDSYLVIYGDAHGPFIGDGSALSFWGWFQYCAVREPDGYPECAVPTTACESQYHQLRLRRLPSI